MPKIPPMLIILATLATLAAVIPPAAVAWSRGNLTDRRPVTLFLDMDLQKKFKAQSTNDLFADGRSMRPLIEGTVAKGEAFGDSHLYGGFVNGQWADTLPAGMEMSMDLLNRGQARFNIYCTPCHGYAGQGDGMVNQRALALVENASGPVQGTVWVPAKSLHDATVAGQPVGQIYGTITNGIRNMASYAAQIPTEDRWAIAAYVKSLQRAFDASIQDVPTTERSKVQ